MGEGRGAWRRFSAWFWGTEAARFALLPVTILFSVFSAVNILNYMDRGIVPGAFQTMGTFIQDDLHVNGTDSYIGGLQSTSARRVPCAAHRAPPAGARRRLPRHAPRQRAGCCCLPCCVSRCAG
ncbi:hypothetical protein EON68_03070, partial [archaeon]